MSDKPVDKPVNMGLQLFPPPPKKKTNPSRKPSARRHAVIPQSPPQSAVERSPSPAFPLDGRQSALDGRQSALGGRETPQTGRQTPQNGRETPQTGRASPISVPQQAHIGAEIPRSQTSFSEAPTLIRSNSNASNTSVPKNTTNGSPQRGDPVMHSIFPRYNPEIPLEHQPYYPTQTSPTHIPRTVINRRPYSPSISGRSAAGLQSPMPIGAAPGRFPRGVQDETILEPSSNEEMKDLWKVVNGWRVSASEGRTFCLRMNSAVEEPVHTLSSSEQAFYTLRLDPTSTSAQMTLTRQDPNRPAKGSGSPKIPTMSSKPNTGMEVLSTTLEEAARRLPPNDGLVALLYPRAASNMAIDVVNKSNRADAEQVIAAAERECGRLVWDEDSKKYYLVHPAISTPFVVSIISSPAWSRSEYVLEHSELPRNLVRLVRDGAGSGFLEIDTGVAARIDCFYIVDVAICAVMLVALAEEKTRNLERFDAPPSLAPGSPKDNKLPKEKKEKEKKEKKSKKAKKADAMEEFDMDLESQESLNDKKEKQKGEKIPGFFGLLWMMIKCFFWTIAMIFKGLAKCIILISTCLTRKK